MKMNLPNAIAFFGIGLGMEALQFFPSFNGVRQLWLLVMGSVFITIGGGVLAHAAWWRFIVPGLQVTARALLPERTPVDTRGPAPEVGSGITI